MQYCQQSPEYVKFGLVGLAAIIIFAAMDITAEWGSNVVQATAHDLGEAIDRAIEKSKAAGCAGAPANGPDDDDNDDDKNNKSLKDKSPEEISKMTRKELEENTPDDWDFQDHNGRIHIKDQNGNWRIRIDPPDNVTNYTHIHIYDEFGNLLDSLSNIVPKNSLYGHIPYN